MPTETTVHVIPARSLPLDDRTLHHLRDVAHDARRGQTSAAEAEFLLATVGPLLDELICWRGLAAGSVRPEEMIVRFPVVR